MNHRFDLLDGARGIAAFAVLAHHLEINAGYQTGYFSHGYLAVDFFYILSGFVIAAAYGERLKAGMGFGAFMRVRLIRLQPLVVLGLLLSVLAQATAGKLAEGWPIAALGQLFYVPAFLPQGDVYMFNGAQWSLLFEMAINIFFFLTYRWMKGPLLWIVLAVNAAALFVVAMKFHGLGVGWGSDNFLGGIPRVGFGFYAGVLLWHLWVGKRVPVIKGSWVLLSLGVLAVILLPGNWPLAGLPLADAVAVVFFMPPLVWMLASTQVSGRLAKAAAFLGMLSYPVYVLQSPVRSMLTQAAGNPQVQSPALLTILFLSVIVAAWLATRAYDEPVRAWLSARFKPRRTA